MVIDFFIHTFFLVLELDIHKFFNILKLDLIQDNSSGKVLPATRIIAFLNHKHIFFLDSSSSVSHLLEEGRKN